MSLIRAKAIQMGYDATASNNFLIYQPLTPDGTFRIANGNQGATTDIMTVSSAGNVTFAGSTNFASLNFGSGTESAPSLYPTGDTNTGIWFPAADTFAVSTNGTERLRAASSGNIGIGTINPGAKLEIVGTNAVEQLRIGNNTGLTTFGITVNENSSVVLNSAEGATGRGIQFQSGGTNTVLINSAGKVAIGTQTIGNGGSNMLTVTGNSVSFNPNTDGKDTFVFTTGVADKAKLMMKDVDVIDIQLATDAVSYINTGNNVGIGTTNPIYDLQVGSYTVDSDSTLALASTTTGTGSIRFGDGASGVEANAGKLYYDHSGDFMEMWTAASPRLRIDSSGNVGVNTGSTTLTRKFHVEGTSFSTIDEANYYNDTGDLNLLPPFNTRLWSELKYGTGTGTISRTTAVFNGRNISAYYLKPNNTSDWTYVRYDGMARDHDYQVPSSAQDVVFEIWVKAVAGTAFTIAIAEGDYWAGAPSKSAGASSTGLTIDGWTLYRAQMTMDDAYRLNCVFGYDYNRTGNEAYFAFPRLYFISGRRGGHWPGLPYNMDASNGELWFYKDGFKIDPTKQMTGSMGGRPYGNVPSSWTRFAYATSAMNGPLTFRVSNGHNSSGSYNVITFDTYCYNIANGTVVSLLNTGSSPGTISIRKVKNNSWGGDGGWDYEIMRNSSYSTDVYIDAFGAQGNFYWTI